MKIGLMGIGLKTYWTQYEGLFPRLCAYSDEIHSRMVAMGGDVVNVGFVDCSERAMQAVEEFNHERIGLLCVYVSTYALSSTVLPVAQAAHCPVLLLNVQPTSAIDYGRINAMGDRALMTAEWLANCQACAVPELASVLARAGIQYDILTGHLHDEQMWRELEEWTRAAAVVDGLRQNRMGLLGHYYCGMLDVYSDLTRLSATFGTHFEIVEMCKLKVLRDQVTAQDVEKKLEEFRQAFSIDPLCPKDELRHAAVTAVALDRMVEQYRLGSVAYYYEGTPASDYENIITTLIPAGTLLTARGIPMAGECEVKNAHAMKIMSLLGAGGSFSEPYAMDFNDDVVLWGHDGPGHWKMAQDGVRLVPLSVFHGKPGRGIGIQMSVRQGPATLLSVCEGKDGVHLLVAEGESVEGETLHIGNTNSRYRFPLHVKEFIERWSKGGPSHHCAIGVGHVASRIEKVAALLGIPVIRVC